MTIYFLICVLSCFISSGLSVEFTFELPDNRKECFFEQATKGQKIYFEYQVVVGGNYDIDAEIVAPSNTAIYKEQRKQYDQTTVEAQETGLYRFCFSNEFSTFTHKVIYFDLQVGDQKAPPRSASDAEKSPLLPMTLMESSAATLHESLKVVIDYQTHHRLRESSGRSFAEDLNDRVQWWSLGQTIVIILVGIGQVLVLRSFFTDRRHAIPTRVFKR